MSKSHDPTDASTPNPDSRGSAKAGPPGPASPGPVSADTAPPGAATPAAATEPPAPLRTWLAFLLPFAIFMVVTSVEPAAVPPAAVPPADVAAAADQPSVPAPATAPAPPADQPKDTAKASWLGLDRSHYPLIYTVKIGLVAACLAQFWPVYRGLGGRISPWAWLVGAVGTAIWVGVCKLGLEDRLLGPLGLGKFLGLGARTAFDPLTELGGTPAIAYGFLAIRFVGLALIVPIIEELFLRGFVMRYLIDPDWWKVSLGSVTPTAIAITTALALAMHPAELFAELIWFSSVTLLMLKTRNLWDCVVAHGVTNLLLGIYVVKTDAWHFW